MGVPILPKFLRGQIFGLPGPSGLRLRRKDAEKLNAIVGAVNQLGKVEAVAPLMLDDLATGRHLWVQGTVKINAKLSGNASPYSWVEVQDSAAGNWTALAGGRSGTANAYEADAIGGLSGKVTTLEPSASGDYRFQWIRSGPPKPPGITLVGCPCRSIPATLRMDVINPEANQNALQSCTLVYGPTPAVYGTPTSGLYMPDHTFVSTEFFYDNYDPNRQYPFQYYFNCFSGVYGVTRIYPKNSAGLPAYDFVRYSFLGGTTFNPCCPFLMIHGTILLGMNPITKLTIVGAGNTNVCEGPGIYATVGNGTGHTTAAGGSDQIQVSLTGAPTATVSVTLVVLADSNGKLQATLGAPNPLAFDATNWQFPQSITITGKNDGVTAAGQSVNYLVSVGATSTDPNYSGISAPSLNMVNQY